MAVLPVPGNIFWNDFAFSTSDFDVFRNDTYIATYAGLADKGFSFFKPDVNIQCGDTLRCNGNVFIVKRIENETYNGHTDLISVHY